MSLSLFCLWLTARIALAISDALRIASVTMQWIATELVEKAVRARIRAALRDAR